MPPTVKCCAQVSEISEPPSRHSQYTLIEATVTAFVDGNLATLFSVVCGYARFPIITLIIAHICLFTYALLSGLDGIFCWFSNIFSNETQSLVMLISLLTQGIGYGCAELIYKKTSDLCKPLKKMFDPYMVTIIKNSFLVFFIALMYTHTNGFLRDLAHGGLYALVVSSLQDIIFKHHTLRFLLQRVLCMLLYLVKKITIPSVIQNKGTVVTLVIIGSCVASGSLYAHGGTMQGSSLIMYGIYLVSLLEQAVIYEYGYRATLLCLQQAQITCHALYNDIRNSCSHLFTINTHMSNN